MNQERAENRIATMRKLISEMFDQNLRIRERAAKMEGLLDDIEQSMEEKRDVNDF